MGRYYNGDIEGKFWFAVQGSDAPTRFGGSSHEPSVILYYFDETHLEEVENEIKRIEENLGIHKLMLDGFFTEPKGYNDEMIISFYEKQDMEITSSQVKAYLSEYADLGLGCQIRDCIKENGSCEFEAEY